MDWYEANRLFDLAYQYSVEGRHDDARSVLAEILSYYPDHIEALVLIGYLSPPPQARYYFMQALRLDPTHPEAQRGIMELEDRSNRLLFRLIGAGIPISIILAVVVLLLGLQLIQNDETLPTPTAIVQQDTATPTPTSTPPPTLTATPFLSPTPRIELRSTPLQFVRHPTAVPVTNTSFPI